MDLGCLDMGCIEKQSNEPVLDSENNANESVMTTSKIGKNKALKEASQSNVSALNKFTSQIKKPPHRKGSPLNWFPRKKVDSYLKRKIKLLQEVSGMKTLDETLGDSNPHYSRVLREKIAVREAAQKAMEARKAAMVEASWCRILRAARIQSKDAEVLLLEAEKRTAEAFEAATAVGVIMHDIQDCSRKHYEIETLSANGGGSTTTTHRVTASFETAFEVDKQVAAAVKAAFNRLANCPSISKEEFQELLRKISQNPDTDENNQELSEVSSECESDAESELESGSQKEDGLSYQDLNCEMAVAEARQRKYKMRQLSEKFNMTKLVDMMLERLMCLHEDELASLATIVATCGLNAALAEAENWKQRDLGSAGDFTSAPAHHVSRRMSSLGAGMVRNSNMEFFMDGQMRKKQVEAEVPSLDKFLVKHMTKLEREVQEAKNTRRKEAGEENRENLDITDNGKVSLVNNTSSAGIIPDLGSILVKHSSKFEKEIEEAKKDSGYMYEKEHKNYNSNMISSEVVPDLGSILTKHSSKLEKEIEETKRKHGKSFELNGNNFDRLQNKGFNRAKQDVTEVPSLDKFLVKHVSKLEREVLEAKNRRKIEKDEGNKVVTDLNKSTPSAQSEGSAASPCSDGGGGVGKENINLTLRPQNATDCSGDSFPPNLGSLSGNEICKTAKTLPQDDDSKENENSLENILVKPPVHRLEREKMQASSQQGDSRFQRYQKKHGGHDITDCESLDKVLVKHVSRLEKEKMGFGMKEEAVKLKRRETNTHLENGEGSLDQILVKHKPRLEREKMAAARQPHEEIKHSASRREARERELQEAWGGLSLGNSVRPHVSRLQRDKAAWLKAEEEERERAI
ncbi:uncharacterized protein LOC132294137 [Cornus florida]|uniref:uncharacterized protein LOC132294137 n=1 Tax=Cornus florida TaxID=4283 RepID=UPI00289AECE9|nr:uncharacterized protein LOC132294137 [Cornus florida]